MKRWPVFLFIAMILLFSCQEQVIHPGKAGINEKKEKKEVVNYAVHQLADLNRSNDIETILCQYWDNTEDEEAITAAGAEAGLEAVYRGFYFFRDGTVIKNPRGYWQEGKWILSDQGKGKLITIRFTDAVQEEYRLAAMTPTAMKLVPTGNENKKPVDYTGYAISHLDIRDDPFHPSNNKWRIKPRTAETTAQLLERLKGCIHFFILYYDHCINAKMTTVNFTGLPSCFRWYAGGIYLQKQNELQQKWIDCFYNKGQAITAYRLAEDLLDKKYNWPKGEQNWVKQNVFVLRQMENKTDSL